MPPAFDAGGIFCVPQAGFSTCFCGTVENLRGVYLFEPKRGKIKDKLYAFEALLYMLGILIMLASPDDLSVSFIAFLLAVPVRQF